MIDEPTIDGDAAVIVLDAKASLAVGYAAARIGKAVDGAFVAFLSERFLRRPDKAAREAVGAQEISAEEFAQFDKQCPRCGFEWDT